MPEWFNVYNGAVRKLLELAPKVPEESAPTEAKIRTRLFDSLKNCKDQDFRTEISVLKNDKTLTLTEIQARLAKADPNAKSSTPTNHNIHDGKTASVSSAVSRASVPEERDVSWGDTVRLSPSGAALGVYYPQPLLKCMTPAQKKEVRQFTTDRKAAGITGFLPHIKTRDEDFCKKLFADLTAKATASKGDGGRGGDGGNPGGGGKGGGGKGGNGRGKGKDKRDRGGKDEEESNKRYKALIASVEKLDGTVKKQAKAIAELTKRGKEAQVGAAEAMSTQSSKEEQGSDKDGVRFANPEGAGKIKGAISSVQQIQKKQDEAVVSDRAYWTAAALRPNLAPWDGGAPTRRQPNRHLSAVVSSFLLATVMCVGAAVAGVRARSTGRAELDTHANLGVVGKSCTVYEETGRTVDVKDFKDSSPSVLGMPIVNCIMAHDRPVHE